MLAPKRSLALAAEAGHRLFEGRRGHEAGEGGAVLTADPMVYERAIRFHDLGLMRPVHQQALGKTAMPNFLGVNYRMPEICAAVGLAQFERVHELVARRQEIARMYRKAIDGCAWMAPQSVPDGYEHTYYTYAVQYLGEEKFGLPWKRFWQRYRDLGGDGFYGACRPPYLEPVYANIKIAGHTFGPGLCPVAEQIQPVFCERGKMSRMINSFARSAP